MKYDNVIFLNREYKWVKGCITEENNIITDVVEYGISEDKGIIPPFSDIHIHGGYGVDVMDCNADAISFLSRKLYEDNVGMWLPTTVAKDFDSVLNTARAVKRAAEKNEGALIGGIHIEGPFISKAYKGIMEEKFIVPCNKTLFDDLKEIMGDMVIRFTVAPEAEGAAEFTEYVTKNGGYVSMGHSQASKKQCESLIEKGANSYTHIFNAMSSLHHRNENILTSALSGNEYCEIIADKIHISEDVLNIALTVLGKRAILITDALRPMGMGQGSFTFCGDEITVRNGRAINNEGRLAGSILKMKYAFINAYKILGIEKAVKAGCENPAKAVGLFDKIGSIEKGKIMPHINMKQAV